MFNVYEFTFKRDQQATSNQDPKLRKESLIDFSHVSTHLFDDPSVMNETCSLSSQRSRPIGDTDVQGNPFNCVSSPGALQGDGNTGLAEINPAGWGRVRKVDTEPSSDSGDSSAVMTERTVCEIIPEPAVRK